MTDETKALLAHLDRLWEELRAAKVRDGLVSAV